MPTLEELLGSGPSGGGIQSPGEAPNPFAGEGGDGAPNSEENPELALSQAYSAMGMEGLEFREKDGLYHATWPGGTRTRLGPAQIINMAQRSGLSIDALRSFGREVGLDFNQGPDGSITGTVSESGPRSPGSPGTPSGGPQTTAQAEGARAAASAQRSADARAAAGASGPAITRGPGGGAGTAASSGAAGGQFAGPGDQSIDPNAALGLDFGSAGGGIEGGSSEFVDPSAFGRPTPFTEGLGPDASLNDIMLGAMGEQRAGRDLALGISGGLASGFEENELRRAAESGALDLVNNPFSLDDQTIARIQGQQGDLIGRNAERLQQSSAARAASAGISRSGIQNAAQDRIDINAARQLGDTQRGLLVEQATRRPQEQAQALAAGSNVLGSQQQQRGQIARGAIDTLANTNLSADAAVLGTLAAGGTPQVNVTGGGGDYRDSREHPGNFNPF